MADRCEFCSVRLDGYEVHADSCPCMNTTIRDESERLRAENEELQEECDDLCAEVERLRRAMPREDEIDSVMSLLNWTREKHDRDSAARQWLERVVDAELAREPK